MENNTVFDSLDFLSDVLKDFCQKHSVDLRSADDILHAETKDKNGFNPLSKYQQAWLKQFVEIWKLMIDSMDKERVLLGDCQKYGRHTDTGRGVCADCGDFL
jgi:hypothetical protein